MTAIEAIKKLEAAERAEPAHLWPALTEEPTSWSGTKGYVWADAYGDVKEGVRAIWDTCVERGLALQAALPQLFSFPDDHPQAHKGLVITFPHRDTLDADIEAVVAALDKAGYRYGAGKTVKGAMNATAGLMNASDRQTSLSTRFEHYIDMGRDVDTFEHSILYRPSLPFMRAEVEALAAELRKMAKGHG